MLDARRKVTSRQVVSGVEGLVSDVRVTEAGRVVVLVEDTGIEGEVGECVDDGKPRRVWAAVREPAAQRFSAARVLESLNFVCSASGAQLASGGGERVVALWGVASEAEPHVPPAVRQADALGGSPFAAPRTSFGGVSLGDAIFDGQGGLAVAGFAAPDREHAYGGPLMIQREGPGAAPVVEKITTAATFAARLASLGAGELLVAWAQQGGVHISATTAP